MNTPYINHAREYRINYLKSPKSGAKQINRIKRRLLVTSIVTLCIIVAVVAAFTATMSFNDKLKTNMTIAPATETPMMPVLGSLNNATGWINSSQISAEDLSGKVVLVDFCTYTCINWIRTVPYVRAWSEKYKNQGLVVIGIHTPEFKFEENLENARREVSNLNVKYAIATDNNYDIWKAFDNHYWPALYLVDAKGQVRFHHFGEGNYDQIEKMIQQLLNEAGSKNVDRDLVYVKGIGIESAPDWSNLRSPENYIGYQRTENFSSPGGAKPEKSRAYTQPSTLQLNQWALSGVWSFADQSILLNKVNGRIVYRFHARDLHIVMGASDGEKTIRFRILIDGKAPGAARGVDVDDEGYGTIKAQRLYQLIRQQEPIKEREFSIEFLDAGAEVFSFTFG